MEIRDLKRGMKLKCRNNKIILKLIKRGGNGHWTCTQVNRKKSHHVHEGTLVRFYEVIKDN